MIVSSSPFASSSHVSEKSFSAKVLLATCFLAIAALGSHANAAPPQAKDAANTVVVTIDNAKIVRLPEKVSTVVIGNPVVADVTVQKNGILVVTGKSYGTTNLIALDQSGNMLVETSVRVEAPANATVTVHRGFDRQTYSCAPNCQPSLLLGDSPEYFSAVSGQTTQRNSLATQR